MNWTYKLIYKFYKINYFAVLAYAHCVFSPKFSYLVNYCKETYIWSVVFQVWVWNIERKQRYLDFVTYIRDKGLESKIFIFILFYLAWWIVHDSCSKVYSHIRFNFFQREKLYTIIYTAWNHINSRTECQYNLISVSYTHLTLPTKA